MALLAQTTLSHDEWRGLMESARDRFPDLWMPNRSDLCFATTNRQASLKAMAQRGRRHRGDRLGQLVQHRRAGDGGPGLGVRRGCCASTRPTSSPTTCAGRSGSRPVPPPRRRLVEEVIAVLAPRLGVTEVTVTTEDEYFPPPPELRELLRAVGNTLGFLAGRPDAPAGRPGVRGPGRLRGRRARHAGLVRRIGAMMAP